MHLDPVTRALANAPPEDEEISEEEERAVAEAREWLKHNKAIPMEQVLAELGFTMEEVMNYDGLPDNQLSGGVDHSNSGGFQR